MLLLLIDFLKDFFFKWVCFFKMHWITRYSSHLTLELIMLWESPPLPPPPTPTSHRPTTPTPRQQQIRDKWAKNKTRIEFQTSGTYKHEKQCLCIVVFKAWCKRKSAVQPCVSLCSLSLPSGLCWASLVSTWGKQNTESSKALSGR